MGTQAGSRPAGRGGARAVVAVGVACVVTVTGLSGPVSGATASGSAGGTPARCSDPVLPGPSRGDAAVRALGAGIVAVAARNRTTPGELARQLRADRTLWLDRCGALFFADEVPADLDLSATSTDEAVWPSTLAPADAFALHSRPGAERVLLLDFDGHLVADTGWNDMYSQGAWTAPAFSTDADPTTFSDAERAVIIETWRRVAQDYAPFDVDVTTQDPGPDAVTRSGSADTRFGTRVLISPDATQTLCACGGRAYIDVFDRSVDHAYTQPAWVYPHVLGNRASSIAEAASHEAGHTLGLRHDGTQTAAYYTGAGGWGPIMGSAYGQAITQWSDGSYPGANNTEDDLAIISGSGAPLLPDDIGGTAQSAMPLGVPGSVSTLVNSRTDLDAFTVATGGGRLTATAQPYLPGPNVDLSLTLADSGGQVLASSAPAFVLSSVPATVGAALDVVVSAGTYTLTIDGTGNGLAGSAGESDYGSVGWYTLTVDAPAAPTPTPSPTATVTPTPTTPTPTPTPSPPPPPVTPLAPPPVAPPPPAVTPAPDGPVTIAPAALVIESRSLPTAQRRKSYRTTLTASGGTGPYTWKRSKGTLPKGLTLTSSGVVHGRAKVKGTKRFRVQVTDSAGGVTRIWLRIRVR